MKRDRPRSYGRWPSPTGHPVVQVWAGHQLDQKNGMSGCCLRLHSAPRSTAPVKRPTGSHRHFLQSTINPSDVSSTDPRPTTAVTAIRDSSPCCSAPCHDALPISPKLSIGLLNILKPQSTFFFSAQTKSLDLVRPLIYLYLWSMRPVSVARVL